jgi:hypothetical protein
MASRLCVHVFDCVRQRACRGFCIALYGDPVWVNLSARIAVRNSKLAKKRLHVTLHQAILSAALFASQWATAARQLPRPR